MPALAEVRGTVDVGVLAIHADDLEAVAERLPEWGGSTRGARAYDLRLLGEHTVALAQGWSGDRVDAARAAAGLIDDLAPDWLVVIGLCSAAPADEPALGDVILATSVLDHGAEAVLADGTHAFAAAPLHPEAVARAAAIGARDLGAWGAPRALGRPAPPVEAARSALYGTQKTKAEVQALLRRRAEAGPRPARLCPGALLASDVPLDEAALLRAVQRAPRRFRAIAAETASVFGLAAARGVPALAIHGVADVIGARRAPAWATYARHTAASLLVAALRADLLGRRAATAPVADPHPDALAEAARLSRLGDAALERGALDEAAQRYGEARAHSRALGDVRGEASGALRFGEVALRRGDAEAARRCYQEALPLFRRIADALGEANCVARLGDLALKRGDADEARHRYQDALPLYRRAADVLGEANCELRLGDLARKRGDAEDARARFEVALNLYAQLPERYSMGLIHRRLGQLAPDERLRRRHTEAARELWVAAGRHDLVTKLDAELAGR
jgi:nucleoside phosphorylase/predicted TPR repeat methyltransferase